jgi:putative membrane protein
VSQGSPGPGDSRFRDHAANERTLLAWVRTGLALMAFGFAIARFALFLREVAQAGPIHLDAVHGLGSSWLGVTLVLLGLVTNAAAVVRYARNRKQLVEVGWVVPDPRLVYALGIGSVLVALAMAILLSTTLRD